MWGMLERHIATQVGEGLQHNPVNQVYSIFLDDPGKIADAQSWQFASGYLVNNPRSAFDNGAKVPDNSCRNVIDPTTHPKGSSGTSRQISMGTIEIQTSSIKAGVVNHPYNNGFVLLSHCGHVHVQ
jgi:hypothetical protein